MLGQEIPGIVQNFWFHFIQSKFVCWRKLNRRIRRSNTWHIVTNIPHSPATASYCHESRTHQHKANFLIQYFKIIKDVNSRNQIKKRIKIKRAKSYTKKPTMKSFVDEWESLLCRRNRMKLAGNEISWDVPCENFSWRGRGLQFHPRFSAHCYQFDRLWLWKGVIIFFPASCDAERRNSPFGARVTLCNWLFTSHRDFSRLWPFSCGKVFYSSMLIIVLRQTQSFSHFSGQERVFKVENWIKLRESGLIPRKLNARLDSFLIVFY